MSIQIARHRQIATVAAVFVLSTSACNSDGRTGDWSVEPETSTSPRTVELYAEFGEPLRTLGVTDPPAVEFRRLGEDYTRPDAVDRVRPADETLQPVEGLPRTQIPLFFWNVGFIEQNLKIPKRRHDLFFRDGLPLRAGIFEATGHFESGPDTGDRTFEFDDMQLLPCRSALATKLQLFPGENHRCVWFGDKRCNIGLWSGNWHFRDENVSDVPTGYERRGFYGFSYQMMCPDRKPVRLKFFIHFRSPEREGPRCKRGRFRPQATADGRCPPDWVKITCGRDENEQSAFYKGLRGHLNGRAVEKGSEEQGLRAIAPRLQPGPKARGLEQCPSGALRFWGTVIKTAKIVRPSELDEVETGPSDVGY